MPTALISAVGGGGLFSGLLGKLISFAISSIFQSMFAPDEPEQPEPEGPLLNKRSNTSSIPVIYGTRKVGGNRVFVSTDGSKNDTLHVVLLVCEGEIDGFQDVYLDDVKLRFNNKPAVFSDNTTYSPIGAVERDNLANDMNTDKYSGLVDITFHNGSDDQAADSGLVNVNGWTSNHRLRGRAYVYVRITYDQDTFSSIPSITTDVRGKRVFDPRTETTGYSENPAVCLRDYLTNTNYGRGLDPLTISDDDIMIAAMYCDENITLLDSAGATISSGARYTLNGVVKTDSTLYSNTQSILTHMRGFLVFTSGRYVLRLDRAETSSVLYDESNIIGSLTAALGTKKNTLNRMRVTFWNPEKNGEDDTIILDPKVLLNTLTSRDQTRVTAAGLVDGDNMVYVRDVLDNGVILSRELQLPYCDSPHVARYIANQEIEQSRQQIKITFDTGIAGLQNDIGDIIRVRHNSMGWGYYTQTIDGQTVLIPEAPITVNNIGQTGIIPNWSPSINYATNATVTFDGLVYVASTDPGTGVSPPNSPWTVLQNFNDIPNLLSEFGLITGPDGNIANNLGIGGGFLYKEFRILGLTMKEQEEVELTCMEYDATVFDAMPLGVVDNTPNTSFTNPNIIPAVDSASLTFSEELYVTSTSGGVKSSVVFNWIEPNTPFIRSYDVFIHRPEESWDIRDDYRIGDKVTNNNGRWEAVRISGPTANDTAITITASDQNITAGTLIAVNTPTEFFRAVIAQTGVNTTNIQANLGNTVLWRPDDGSGAVEPFVGSVHWTQLLVVADEDYIFQTSTTGREFTLLDSKPGTHDIRLRPNSVTGVRGPFTTRTDISILGLIRAPSDITGFGLAIEGTLALLTWTPSADLDVRIGGSIQVRHNPGIIATDTQTASEVFAGADLDSLWNNSAVLTEGKSGVTSQILVPLLQGAYMMKAFDSSGIQSITPAAILNEVGSEVRLFPITNISENPNWDGISIDADTIVGNDSTNVELSGSELRLSTLADWSPTTPYAEGDQVLYNGAVYEVRAGQSVSEPAPGANNETPQGELISQWGLISQRGSIVSEEWVAATRNALTVLDIPQFTSGTYYFNNDIVFDDVESQEIAPIINFSAQNIGGTIDNLADPIDSLLTNIEDLGDPFAAASTNVRMEVSTTSNTGALTAIPDNEWSTYTTFTSGSYNFRAARFRIVINTSVIGTQVTVSEAGIETNLPAKTLNNTSSLAWVGTEEGVNPGFEDVIYENTSGGNSFHGGGTSSNSGISKPDIAIVAENIFPGEYFIVTTNNAPIGGTLCTAANGTFTLDDPQPTSEGACGVRGGTFTSGTCTGAGTCTDHDTDLSGGVEADAPDPNEGFRIRFFRVRTATVSGVKVQRVPDPAADGTVQDKTLNFDYQATGY